MANSHLNPLTRPYYPRCQEKLNLFSINFRSVLNKSAELSAIAEIHRPDIICLSETWLAPSVALSISGYTTFRHDRPPNENKSGTASRGYGGVAILVRDHRFSCIQLRNDLSRPTCETVWVELKPCSGSPKPIIVCSAYRPPSAKSTEINHFCNMLTDALVTIPMSSYHVILTGDFNCKHQHWCPTDSTSPAGAALYRHLTCFGLEQLVNTPTHTTPAGTQACLDLLFVNNPQLATDINTTCALGSSDHLTVLCWFELSPSPGQHLQQAPRKHFPYRNRHVPSHCWDSLNSDLSHCDWSFLRPGNSPTVDDAVDRFSIVLEQTFQHHLADFSTHSCRSNTRTSSVTSNPPWVSTVLVSAVKRKRDLFSVSRKFPTPVNMEAYRVQRNFVKYLSRKTYRSYISSLSATISSPNRPSLYQFIRTQRPSVSRAPIQCLIDPDGNSQSEAKSIADTLNKQFVSPGLPDDPNWVIPEYIIGIPLTTTSTARRPC
ncbi:uncharacterized protein LOC135830834 [Sycon ciliatum]|uniref:uncharacterized protein LOC135830834 n=1 Tax=Sycon ciliatum TaxID=27933 RepID=UPI0031F711D8